MLPFLTAFFITLLYPDKVLLCTMPIFLSSYLKTKKNVAFCRLLVL